MRSGLAVSLVLVLALSTAAAALANVRLAEPWVFKTAWETRAHQVVDADGDGRTDVAFLNNTELTLDWLRQVTVEEAAAARRAAAAGATRDPVFSDAPFVRERFTLGRQAFALAVDPATDTQPVAFVVWESDERVRRYVRTGEDGWEEVWRFPVRGVPTSEDVLQLQDLDGDGARDLLALTEGALLVFSERTADGWAAPVRYPLAAQPARALTLTDLDGDGQRDVVYLAGTSTPRLFWRRQQQGRLGPEHWVADEAATGQLIEITPGTVGKPAELAWLAAPRATAQVFRVARAHELTNAVDMPPLRATRYGAGEADGGSTAAWADLNGDGRTDLLVSLGAAAELVVWPQEADGALALPQRYPTLQYISALAAGVVAGSEHPVIVAVSREERMAGWIDPGEDGVMPFPRRLPTAHAPEAVVILDGPGGGELVVLTRDVDADTLYAERFTRNDDGFNRSAVDALGTSRREVAGALVADLDGDGRDDLIVRIARDPARLYRNTGDGFVEVAADAAMRQRLLDDIDPRHLSIVRGDKAGATDDLLVAARGFVRRLRLEGNDTLQVVAQINLDDRNQQPTGPLWGEAAEGEAYLLFYDERDEALVRVPVDATDIAAAARRWPMGDSEIVRAALVPWDDGGTPRPVFFGDGYFVVVVAGERPWEVQVANRWEAGDGARTFSYVATGDLDGNGLREIVALDGREHVVEIWRRAAADGAFAQLLQWEAFTTSPHFQGRRGGALEPRAAHVADINNDGRNDLVLVVHDRLLFYPQVDPVSADDL